jgi:hypothetical protein
MQNENDNVISKVNFRINNGFSSTLSISTKVEPLRVIDLQETISL